MVMSEIAVSLLPSTVPSVVIHTSRYDVGVALSTVMVLEPVFMAVGGDSTVVSSSVAGVADCAERSCTDVPVLLSTTLTDAIVVGRGSCRISPTPFLKPGNGTGSL